MPTPKLTLTPATLPLLMLRWPDRPASVDADDPFRAGRKAAAARTPAAAGRAMVAGGDAGKTQGRAGNTKPSGGQTKAQTQCRQGAGYR